MKTRALILLLFISFSLFSQRKTYYGLELGLTNPRLIHSNTSAISFPKELEHLILGFNLRQELSEKISLQTGYSHHIYMERFQVDQIYVSPGAFATHQIPLMLRVSNNIIKEKIQLFASIGPHFCMEPSSGMILHEGCDGFGKRVSVWYNTKEKYYTLVGGELGIIFKPVDELLLTLTGGFNYGLRKIRHYEVEYWDGDILLGSMKSYSKGEFWEIKFGISYPLGRIRKLVREAYDSALEDGRLRK